MGLAFKLHLLYKLVSECYGGIEQQLSMSALTLDPGPLLLDDCFYFFLACPYVILSS